MQQGRRMRSTQLLLTLVLGSYLAAAQDVGLLTSVKGTVVVKKSSGQSQRASVKDALSVGDEVATANGASATLMYYTGKEVYLSSNKTYVVAKEGKEDTFLTRLANVFSNLLWSRQKTKSVLGASRGFDAKVNPGIRGSIRASPSLVDLSCHSSGATPDRNPGGAMS